MLKGGQVRAIVRLYDRGMIQQQTGSRCDDIWNILTDEYIVGMSHEDADSWIRYIEVFE